MNYLIVVPVILMSIILHEVSHGYAAYKLGDSTAKYNGRLSLNPLRHIDIFGTIILPILLLLATKGGLAFGFAKPVPINPNNFSYKTRKRDIGITAVAGPLVNIIIAIIFSLIFRLIGNVAVPMGTIFSRVLLFFAETSFLIAFFNLVLAFFNLIPFPPLDGSKILGAFLPDKLYYRYVVFERQGMLIFMGLIILSYIFNWNLIELVILPPVSFVLSLLTGMKL